MDELYGLLVCGIPGSLAALGLAALLDADVPAKVRPTHREVLQVSALPEVKQEDNDHLDLRLSSDFQLIMFMVHSNISRFIHNLNYFVL